MKWTVGLRQAGVPAALGAALLFGAGTPLAKLLLTNVSPWLLAGLLYLGAGIGLGIGLALQRLRLQRLPKRAPTVTLKRTEWLWLAAAITAGGIMAPVLLMLGLIGMPASGASLLLNMEAVFTTLLAWFVFKENADRRIAFGIAFILLGACLLSWPGWGHASREVQFESWWPSLAIVAACFAWALDNNLTRKIALNDASWIACIKGWVAGTVNLALAFAMGASLPSLPHWAAAMVVGFLAYGVSLALFIVALRHLGTARTGAYFSVAPFFGALLAIVLGEPLTLELSIAAGLMAMGIWLHLTEHHQHTHWHTALEHEHRHVHDEHHLHVHEENVQAGTAHSHPHQHASLHHSHPHFPDAHHEHPH